MQMVYTADADFVRLSQSILFMIGGHGDAGARTDGYRQGDSSQYGRLHGV